MKKTRQTLDETFQIIEAAAIKGERCPMGGGHGGPLLAPNVTTLAHNGRIKVEISGLNWRTVTILDGPHRGKATAPNPDKFRRAAYLTIDKHGTFRNGKRINGRVNQPSAPRPLTRDELA